MLRTLMANLTQRLLCLLGAFVTGGVGLECVAAAVQGVVAVLVIQDPREADLPLVAVPTQLGVQPEPTAVQVLKVTDGKERNPTG